MVKYNLDDKVMILENIHGYSEDFTGKVGVVEAATTTGVYVKVTYEDSRESSLYFMYKSVVPVGQWIKWDGGKRCPIPHGTKIIVKYRGADIQPRESFAGDTYSIYWDHWGSKSDIIAYYIKDVVDNEDGASAYNSKELQVHFKLLVPEQSSATAPDILQEAAECLTARAVERDKEGGERSMKAAIEAFNALTGHTLTEEQGYVFMTVLKISRSQGGCFKLDDFVDMAAYAALAGEAGGKQC